MSTLEIYVSPHVAEQASETSRSVQKEESAKKTNEGLDKALEQYLAQFPPEERGVSLTPVLFVVSFKDVLTCSQTINLARFTLLRYAEMLANYNWSKGC